MPPCSQPSRSGRPPPCVPRALGHAGRLLVSTGGRREPQAHSGPASQTAPAAASPQRLSCCVLTQEAAGAGQTEGSFLPLPGRAPLPELSSCEPTAKTVARRPAGLSPAQPAGTAAVGGRLAEMQREGEGPRVRVPQTPALPRPRGWQGGEPASVRCVRVWFIIALATGLSMGDSRKESWPSKHPAGTGLWTAGPRAGGTRSA